MKKTLKRTALTFLSALLIVPLALSGCGKKNEENSNVPSFDGLTYEKTVEREYAGQFNIYNYEGGYKYLEIAENGGKLLVVPEGGKVPDNLEDDVIVVKQPLGKIYMAATSAMALFDMVDSIEAISYSGLKADGWAIANAAAAMNRGEILYAGKYNAPDYEMLVDGGCSLAIESTMIYHNPEVKEKLEELGIPVIVERSSYEDNPLGRTEWVKFYGALLGREEEAAKAFEKQAEKIEPFKNAESTGKKVAFFYINSRGNVVTYKAKGYLPEMIKMAGGEYALSNLVDDSKLSTINMTMEQFYADAVDADILIYNSSIADELDTLDQLLALSSVLADFKAVKEGNTWCTSKSMFQETDKMGSIIEDMNKIITGKAGDGAELEYIHKLD